MMTNPRKEGDMNEVKIRQLFQQDLSVGTESFRNALLEQCLETLRDSENGSVISDETLDLLAAAGDPFAQAPSSNDDNQ